jgi:CheY-like chemotaxis protein
VGLDVVRAQLQSLQGHVEVLSRPGQGTQFTMTVPTELGSSPVLLVRCGEHQFGVPMSALERMVASTSVAVRAGRTRMTMQFDDQVLPLADLGALLGLRQPDPPKDGQPVLVLQSKGHRLAVAVDEVLDQGDFVIHPPPNEVRNIAAYQGVSSLARGELVMVLRPDWVTQAEGQAQGVVGSRRALVVDDSLTARAMHRTVLEAGGYSVHAMGNARQALAQLKRATYDVIVCDVRMEGMDGIAFTTAVRASAETKTVPVILVSALDSEEDRLRGRDAGADSFLSKKDCVEGRLLAEVSAVVTRRRGDG